MTLRDAKQIDSTISPGAASQGTWDVIVMGAGPAGSVAAYGCARLGAKVLLVDKASFPRPKVCGCCLSDAAVRSLDQMQLGDVIAASGAHRLTALQLCASGRSASLPLPGGVAISRDLFDVSLINRAIDAGVSFMPSCAADVAACDETSRRVWLDPANEDRRYSANARVVVVATGLRTQLPGNLSHLAADVVESACIGVSTHVDRDNSPAAYEPGVIYMACGRDAYVGLVRLEDDRLDVAAAVRPIVMREAGGCGGALSEILRDAGLPAVDALADARWQGTPKLTRRAQRVAGERVLLAGDAAGYVEPLTGEGMAWAIASGWAAARWAAAARESEAWDASLESAWQREHRRLFRRPQLRCRLITAAARRPWAVRGAVGALRALPRLGRPTVRLATQANQAAWRLHQESGVQA